MCLSLPRICFLAYIHTHTHIYTHTYTHTPTPHLGDLRPGEREEGARHWACNPIPTACAIFSLSLSLSLSSPQQSCTTRRGVLSELNNIALARNTRPLKLLSPTGGGLITKTQTYFFFPPCVSLSLWLTRFTFLQQKMKKKIYWNNWQPYLYGMLVWRDALRFFGFQWSNGVGVTWGILLFI